MPLLRRAIDINLAQRDSRSPVLVFQYDNLGIALRGTGDLAGGEAAFRKALVPAKLHKHRNLAPILVNLADAVCERRDTATGFAVLTEAAPIMARTYPDEPWRTAWVDVIRANCLMAAGRRAEALTVIEPAARTIVARWTPGSHYAARTDALLKAARAGS